MTALGGLGHSLPFFMHDFWHAFTLAVGVVIAELLVIAWIRHRYMDTPLLSPLSKWWWAVCSFSSRAS